MPKLRPDEKMQRCQSEFHDIIRRQKYYIKRTYYNELEQKFCPGCCSYIMHSRGILKYVVDGGYIPNTNISLKDILATFTAEAFQDGR